MFLSFLKSMQTKSQDAQNPGLWVNGNRMPVQENASSLPAAEALAWKIKNPFPGINALDNEKYAAKSWTDKAGTIGYSGINPRINSGDNTKSPGEDENNNQNTQALGSGTALRWVSPAGVMRKGDSGGKLEQTLNNSPIQRREVEGPSVGTRTRNQELPAERDHQGYNPWGASSEAQDDMPTNPGDYSIIDNPNASYGTDDPIARSIRAREAGKVTGDYTPKGLNTRRHQTMKEKFPFLKENTNRSMFLTHLQGMQTKSQDVQNPGLWVNGNRKINPNS
jgi:hypothetical protein